MGWVEPQSGAAWATKRKEHCEGPLWGSGATLNQSPNQPAHLPQQEWNLLEQAQ
jgi:hypothetical protein